MSLSAIQGILLMLLILVAACALLAERVKVPYPIVLLLAGLGLSFVPHVPRIPLEPEVVFLVFLPPLLYHAAWLTSWRDFKKNLLPISMLAIGLVTFTVAGVAFFAEKFITALDWKSGFLLGAVVATTDAIAATSIGKRIGLPKAIMDILEGESLVNDATGLLALEFGVLIVVHGQTPTVGMALGRLLWLVVGGVGVGLLLGLLVTWLERRIDDAPVEIIVSLVTPYAAYLLGERIEASGVLSVVACGLLVSRRSNEFFSPAARMQVNSVWRSLDFTLNGLVFCLIGLQLPYVLSGIMNRYAWTTLVQYGFVFSAVLVALRLLWIYPVTWLAWSIRRRFSSPPNLRPPSARGVFVVGWTGMRGVVTLAAAIGLPNQLADGRPFEQRDLIVFLAFCVILVTLVGQGMTLPILIRLLGLAGVDTEVVAERRLARRVALEAAVCWVQAERQKADPSTWPFFDNYLRVAEGRLESVSEEVNPETNEKAMKLQDLMRGAAREQRHALLKLRDEGRVGDEAVRLVERELDLTETRLDVASL